MPKKAVASMQPRGSSFSEYDRTQFVSADDEVRFHDSVTQHFGIKDRGFDIERTLGKRTFRELFRVGGGNCFANTLKPL